MKLYHLKWALPSFTQFHVAALFLIVCGSNLLPADEPGQGPAEKILIDFNSPDAARQVTETKGIPAGSTVAVDKTGIVVNFTPWQKGDADHPGFQVVPATGTSWDLSAYGHVEAKITNTGAVGINIVLHVVPTGEGPWTERNLESMQIKPGETKTLKVIFGYSRGFKPVAPPAFNPASVAEIYIYLYHSIQPHAFRIDELKAAGASGEVPVAVPASAAK